MIKRGANSKKDRKDAPRVAVALVLGAVVLLILVILAMCVGWLRDIWQRQCVIRNPELDVCITSGPMVQPKLVTWHFGLTNGANLAQIPFGKLRKDLLMQPNISGIRIERRQPNRVIINVEERKPLVRVVSRQIKKDAGRVADANGVVFSCFVGNTSLLPVVHEADSTLTLPGKKLSGNAAAALRLVEVAERPELSQLRIHDIETSHPDYLLVTLGNYDRAKIAWDHMHEDTKASRDSLYRQLTHLSHAISANLTPSTTMWIATDWGKGARIFASPPSSSGNQ